MNKRQYSVIQQNPNSKTSSGNYILRLRRTLDKKARREEPIDFKRYSDSIYAKCDAARLEALFVANKRFRISSFQPDYDGSVFKTLSKAEVKRAVKFTENCMTESIAPVMGGVVAKQHMRRDDRMYREYANRARKAESDVLSREDWDQLLLRYVKYSKFARKCGSGMVMDRDEWLGRNRSVSNFDREVRALSRNRQTRESYFLDCAKSQDEADIAKAIDNAKRYLSERQSKLSADCKDYEKQILSLLDAIHGCKTYTKVIKAKYIDLPGELIDLTDEPDFTLETISPAQLARVGSQCDAVYRMFEALKLKATKELELIAADLKDIHESHDVLATIEAFYAKKKILLQENSMPIIADNISKDLRGHLAGKTILHYFNEYVKYEGFKEDLRGKHQRLFFLDTFNYTKRWEYWLRYTPHVSVQAAKDELESIIRSNMPEDVEERKKVESMLPLTLSTVHTWMMKAGMKYKKAEATYYTDSHEAAATKEDMQTRYLPAQLTDMVRRPVWVSIPLSQATPAALEYREAIVKAAGLDTLIDPVAADQVKLPERSAEIPDPLVKVHVDFLSGPQHTSYRTEMMEKFKRPGEYFFELPVASPGEGWSFLKGPFDKENGRCRNGHPKEVCKCHLPAYKIGQDEAAFKQNVLPAYYWSYKGREKLRPKTEGQGIMISVTFGETRG